MPMSSPVLMVEVEDTIYIHTIYTISLNIIYILFVQYPEDKWVTIDPVVYKESRGFSHDTH